MLEPLEPRILMTAASAAPTPDAATVYLDLQDAAITVTDRSRSAVDHSTTTTGDPQRVAGRFGKGLRFDGLDDWITLPNSSETNLGTFDQRTVAFWFNADELHTSSGRQMLFEEGAGTRGLNIYLDNDTLFAGGWNIPAGESNWAGDWIETDRVKQGKWHHVALVIDAGPTLEPDAMSLYLDGRLVDRAPASQLWAHSGDIVIGGNGNTRYPDTGSASSTDAFTGRIDEVVMSNDPLTRRGVAALADRLGTYPTDEPESLFPASDAANPASPDFITPIGWSTPPTGYGSQPIIDLAPPTLPDAPATPPASTPAPPPVQPGSAPGSTPGSPAL